MKRICVWALVSVLVGLAPAAFAKTHRDTYPVSCDVLWPAVKDVVRNSGKYGIIGIDSTEMSISYNIGGGLGGKRINSVVLNRKGDKECEMQTQTAYSGMIHNDAGDFKERVEKSLAEQKKAAEAAPKKEVVAEAKKELVQERQPAPSGGNQQAAPTASSLEQGLLILNSDAGAVQVYIDGAAVGTTPAKVKLSAGKHKIRALLDGYDPWEREVEVLADSEISMKIVLKKSGI